MSTMNPRVVRVAEGLLRDYRVERRNLRQLPVPELVELEHEMEHLRRHPDFSIRSAAEIVRAAAVMEREERAPNEKITRDDGQERRVATKKGIE